VTSPFAAAYSPAPPDEELARQAVAGDAPALEALLRRHERWIYNLALRMLQSAADAEDATQEILIRIATRLASFREESAFRTWAYRLAVRSVLDHRRSRPEQVVKGFGCYAGLLAASPDEDPPDGATPADERLVVEEAKLSCLLGMLLCLDRDQRLAFVLGELFDASDAVAGELLGLSREAFRQRLSRAREQVYSFARGHCGLMDARNPCRCARKTRAFVRAGIVDPDRLLFSPPHVARMHEEAARGRAVLDAAVGEAGATIWRATPIAQPPDLVGRLRELLARDPLRAALRLH
jgi:RNA polymerase sigma factor (sigma-70 family)